jgi:hypothetical protein
MLQERRLITLCLVLIGILIVPLLIHLPDVGAELSIISLVYDPDQPTVLDEFNVSMVLSEPALGTNISYCGPGEFGLCYPPEVFERIGTGASYFILFESGRFQEGDYHFNVSIQSTDLTMIYRDFIAVFGPAPTSIAIKDLDPPTGQSINLFPGQAMSITGHVENDLGEVVAGCRVNLSLQGTDTFVESRTDALGNFSSSLTLTDTGSFIADLNVTDTELGFTASATWPITISDWPLPALTLDAYLIFDPSNSPIGSGGYTLYSGSNLSLNYSYENTGTGPALNFTIVTNVSGSVGILGPIDLVNGRYINGSMALPTDAVGEFSVLLNCTFDQLAPEELKGEEPGASFDYTIVDRPTWEPHRVLVEMFTQITCVPCVNVEEALESFHDLEPDLFEFVMYVIDDEPSSLIADQRDISATPHVFIDGNFSEIVGGGEVQDVVSTLNGSIWNASKRIAPPIGISLTGVEGRYLAEVSLSAEYAENVSGYLVVSAVESYSNLRNDQGIPVRNRYSSELNRSDTIILAPGDSFDLGGIVGTGIGKDLVAVFYDENSTVLQVKRTHIASDPIVYLKKGTPIVEIEGIGNSSFDLTVEAFHRGGGIPEDIEYWITLRSVPEQMVLRETDVGVIGTDVKTGIFDLDENEVLPCGRTRVHGKLSFEVETLENLGRTISFQINLTVGGITYSNAVVLKQTKAVTQPKINIVSYSLIGDGMSIYFTASVLNLPDGARLIGTVRPSTVAGSSGQTGAPVTVTLLAINETYYKAPVPMIDLNSYDHLAYDLKVELGATVLNRTMERTVLISDLIEVDDEDDDDDGPSIIIAISAITAIIVLSIIALTLFLVLRRRPQAVEEEGIVEGPEPVGPEEMVTGNAPEDPSAAISSEEGTSAEDPSSLPHAPELNDAPVPENDDDQMSST